MSAFQESNRISTQLLEAFSMEIVDRYYGGDLGKALVDLMEKALIEEELLQAHLNKRKYRLDVKPQKRTGEEASI